MNEEKNVNTTAEDKDTAKQATAPENNVIDTKRRIKFQSPIKVVHVPKEKKQKTTEEPAAEDNEPKEKGEKLKKIRRIVTGIGLVTGAALVGVGTYLKGRGDGETNLANDILDAMNSEEEKEPDPAGVNESESSDD